MILGFDASSYLEEIENGAKYYDATGEIDPLDAFMANGVDHMRIRVWNHPFSPTGEPYLAGNSDISQYVKLAKLAKGKGYKLLLDFHYSDFWADPGKQCIPKAWIGYTLDELTEAVYQFTKECLEFAVREDVAPQMIQVGNEITNGMLWPIGQLTGGEHGCVREGYHNLVKLLKAGCRACREVLPQAKLILHLERSHDQAVYQEFFTQMEMAEVDYDIIGASYYPYWHGTPDELFANLDNCRRFGKDIMVVELGYGFTKEGYYLNGVERRLVIDEERSHVPGVTDVYPLTPKGQEAYIKNFLARAREQGIAGVFYWEPLWLPGEHICWASPAGQAYIHEEGKSTSNEWANQCLFDYEGQKLPAFDAFR
jgi:arabinogalactan endo-1,4-beta-galactosidase